MLWLKDPRRTGMIQVIIKKNLFIIYIIWVDGGYQGLVNSEGKKKKAIVWKEGGGASEGNWILMWNC